MPSHHGPPATELVRGFMNTPVMLQFQADSATRKPSTLSTLERRWFVGRRSLEKAMEKHAMIDMCLLSTPTLGANLELVGTTAMLQLAQPGRCGADGYNNHVSVRPSLAALGWTEFVLRVPVGRRGGRRPKGQKQGVIKWKTNGASMGEKTYFVHDSVVAAGYQYIALLPSAKPGNVDNKMATSPGSAVLPGSPPAYSCTLPVDNAEIHCTGVPSPAAPSPMSGEAELLPSPGLFMEFTASQESEHDEYAPAVMWTGQPVDATSPGTSLLTLPEASVLQAPSEEEEAPVAVGRRLNTNETEFMPASEDPTVELSLHLPGHSSGAFMFRSIADDRPTEPVDEPAAVVPLGFEELAEDAQVEGVMKTAIALECGAEGGSFGPIRPDSGLPSELVHSDEPWMGLHG